MLAARGVAVNLLGIEARGEHGQPHTDSRAAGFRAGSLSRGVSPQPVAVPRLRGLHGGVRLDSDKLGEQNKLHLFIVVRRAKRIVRSKGVCESGDYIQTYWLRFPFKCCLQERTVRS